MEKCGHGSRVVTRVFFLPLGRATKNVVVGTEGSGAQAYEKDSKLRTSHAGNNRRHQKSREQLSSQTSVIVEEKGIPRRSV